MKLPGTGEAASFRFNIYVPLNRREKKIIPDKLSCQLVIDFQLKLHWIAIQNVSWKAKQKVKE